MLCDSAIKSDNALTQLCSKLVLSGSRSAICNSLTYVSALLKYNRNDIVYYNTSKHDFKHNKCDAVTSSVIRDVLHMKYQNYYDRSQSFLSYDELNMLLIVTCALLKSHVNFFRYIIVFYVLI